MAEGFDIFRQQALSLGMSEQADIKNYVREASDAAAANLIKANKAAHELKLAEATRLKQEKLEEIARLRQEKLDDEARLRQIQLDEDARQLKIAQDKVLFEQQLEQEHLKQKLFLEQEQFKLASQKSLLQQEQAKHDLELHLLVEKSKMDYDIEIQKLKVLESNHEKSLENSLSVTQISASASKTNLTESIRSGVRDIPPLKGNTRDEIELYLDKFVRICELENIPKTSYSKLLAPKLTGSLAELLVRLDPVVAMDFDALRDKIFQTYVLDAVYFRNRFYNARQLPTESALEFFSRLRSLLDKWLHSEKINQTYNDIIDFILRNQFMYLCQKDDPNKLLFIKEREVKSLDDMGRLADIYTTAHMDSKKVWERIANSNNSSQNTHSNYSNRNSNFAKPYQTNYNPVQTGSPPVVVEHATSAPQTNVNSRSGVIPTCTACHKKGHLEARCFSAHPELRTTHTDNRKPDDSKPKPFQKKSAGMQLIAPVTKSLIFQNSKFAENLEPKVVHNQTHTRYMGSNQMVALLDGDDASIASMQHIKLISDKSQTESLNPFTLGTVNGIPNTEIMRDSGSFTSVIRSDLVKPSQLTGRSVSVKFANGQVSTFQTALIPVQCRFVDAVVEMCVFDNPFTPVILGNHPMINSCFENLSNNNGDASVSNFENLSTSDSINTDENVSIVVVATDEPCMVQSSHIPVSNDISLEDRSVVSHSNVDNIGMVVVDSVSSVVSDCFPVNAVQTRASAANKKNKVVQHSATIDLQIPDISPSEVARLQKEDPTLSHIWENLDKNEDYRNYEIKNGFLYRTVPRHRLGELEMISQLVVPQSLRSTILKISHESILGGHFGHNKTLDKIYQCFTWPNCAKDTKLFTHSCDICQRTAKKGTFPKAPMQIGKLADMPFQHISVDLIGEIVPPSKAGHRWVLTIVDNCTRYVEAITLKKIDTITVYEALETFMLRMGFCETISSDNGSQFTSDLMEQILKQLKIFHIRCSPYHAQSNGIVERFNQTLKKCLMRLCHEKVADWHLFLPACLMAIRETTNSSTGFSSNELVFGRTLKGPMQILKQLMTHEVLDTEVKTTYQYVLDLREKIQDTCDLVKQELRKSQLKNKIYFDRRARHRSFKVGDLVLLLLPLKDNKLEMHWQGPFPVRKKVGLYDYQIEMSSGKLKVFHINMLKLYVQRPDETTSTLTVAAIACVVEEEPHSEDLMVDDSELLIHYNTIQTETYTDVEIDDRLSKAQTDEIKKLLYEFRDIFSDVPKITNLGEHEIILNSDDIVQSKPYPVPIHLREKLDREIDAMLDAGLIIPSTGPFASPLVLVAKPDKSIRVCVNYKALNSISQFDPEPMNSADDIFDKLGGSKYLSKFDMSKGYYAVKLTKDSQKFSTFTTSSRGLFQFTVMPFGLSSAPATFNRIMRKLLQDTSNLDSYLDDVLTHTGGWKSHTDAIRVFFTRVREGNLSLKPSKCKIGGSTIDFLGHRVVEDSKIPNPDNLRKIIDAARPDTKTKVKSLLGSCGFYSTYIPRYSDIITPLTDCLRKAQPNKIVWGDSQEESFQSLKKAFLSQPILKLVCIDKPFVLRTDASDVGVSAVILQEHSGILHPVCFGSRKLCDRECRYSISERECLAVVWGTQKFHKYLYGRHFVLETDHKPLSILKVSDSSSPRLQRWSLALQVYNFTVQHISGENCLISDWLSRHF